MSSLVFTVMRFFSFFAFLLVILFSSCRKEEITPSVNQSQVMSTRGCDANSNSDGNNDDNENGGITDPDSESEEDKIRSKKKKGK